MGFKAALLFITCAMLLLMSLFYRVSTAIIAPVLCADLRLTPHDLGLLGGSFFYCFAVTQLPLGVFIDRIGARRIMIFMNGLAVVGALVFAGSESLFYAVLGRSLLGIGMAGNLMGPILIFAKWFRPEKLATLSGILLATASLGNLAASSPLAVLVQFLGWRLTFNLLGGVNLLLIVSLLLFVQDRPERPGGIDRSVRTNPAWWPSYKMLFTSWSFWAIALSVFFRYGAFASIQSLWAGPFLIEFLRLSPITAGNILLMLNLGYSFGAPCGGYVSDQLLRSRKKTVYYAYTIAACATLVLAELHGSLSLGLLSAVFFVIGFVNAFNQISFIHAKELMPEQISGSAMTGTNFFGMMGAGFFIHGLGLIFDNSSAAMGSGAAYSDAFLVCFGAFVAALICYLPVREPKKAAAVR